MRAFAAIELDAGLCDALSAAIRAMQAAKPPLTPKWVTPEHQHLTLHFFGEIDTNRADEITLALHRAAGRVAPFEISLAELGCFPNIYKPNVLWVGVHESSGALMRLHKAVEAALAPLGIAPEPRAFTPHLTLARVPRDAGTPALRHSDTPTSASEQACIGAGVHRSRRSPIGNSGRGLPEQVVAKKALGDWFVRQPPPAPVVQRVEQIHLMRSDLFSEGHRHTTLSIAPLTADGQA
jgi:RNA 2',3'-cyclic 3'-phosphodiesterase